MQISHSLTRSRRTSGRGYSEFESAKIYRFWWSTRSPKFGVIKFLWERASFPAHTQSFLCGKFFTARLEVLPNLRHGGVFQMSTMVNFGIGLTRRWAFSLRLRKITGDTLYTNSGLLESGLKVRKCHVMLFLRTCMSQVILTSSFKVTAEIEIRKHMFCIVLRSRGVSAF